jgi:hypothetical protein
MDPKARQSLLEWLGGMISQCAEISTRDERFKRVHKLLIDCSEYVKCPDEYSLQYLVLMNEADALVREGLLKEQLAMDLKRILGLVNPPDPNAGRKLYRMAYPPWWKRLFGLG